MRGYEDQNRPMFFHATECLRKEGHEVYNPAEDDVLWEKHNNGTFTFAEAMSRDLAQVCKQEAVVVLPGWQQSQGARMEVFVGRELELQILQYPDLQPVPDFKPTNAKDVVAVSKLDLSLYPDTAVAYGALAMSEGDLKYGGYNYRPGGVLASTYVAALRRHLSKWWNGQDDDPRTLVPHLASVNACSAILIDAIECGVLQDDRPPRVEMEKTYSKLERVLQHLRSIFKTKVQRYTEKGKK